MHITKIPYIYSGQIFMNTKNEDTNKLCWDIRNQYNHDYSDGSSMQKFNNSDTTPTNTTCITHSTWMRSLRIT
jgi:hypothetical protein